MFILIYFSKSSKVKRVDPKTAKTKNNNVTKQDAEEGETKKRQYKPCSICGKKRHMKDSNCPGAKKK